MPINLEFFQNGVRLHHIGAIDDADLLQAQKDLYDHDYPDKLQFQILDLVKVSDFQASGDTMRKLGRQDLEYAKTVHPQHVVVIAPSEGRVESIIWEAWARDAQPTDSSIKTSIVTSVEEASIWLEQNGIDVKPESE